LICFVLVSITQNAEKAKLTNSSSQKWFFFSWFKTSHLLWVQLLELFIFFLHLRNFCCLYEVTEGLWWLI
jgi:hypothetical protein